MNWILERVVKWITVGTWPAMVAAMAITYNGGPTFIAFLLIAAGMFGWAYSMLFWLFKKRGQ